MEKSVNLKKESQILKARLNQLLQKSNHKKSKIGNARKNFYDGINKLTELMVFHALPAKDLEDILERIREYPDTMHDIMWEAQEINDLTFRLKNLYLASTELTSDSLPPQGGK